MVMKVMLIRHGEKPTVKHQPPYGVTIDGEGDWESLTVFGWQRAGALANLFAPCRGEAVAPLVAPEVIYASKPRDPGMAPSDDDASKSKRPLQTIMALATKLGISPNLAFGKGDEASLASDTISQDKVVLISWQHEKIQDIVGHLVGDKSVQPGIPAVKWPDDRFDLVWVLDPPAPGTGAWIFTQVPQLLLPGDQKTTIG
jgi:hypothetical protein